MSEKTRYSDAELEEFRQIINEKLEKAYRDYDLLKASIMNTDGNDVTETYGICRETGKLIPKERLRAVPHATLGIDAKEDGKRK